MDHYFKNTSGQTSNPRDLQIRVREVELHLESDSGVFSKRGLDYGTRVLVDNVELPPKALAVDLGCGYGPVAAILGRVFPDSRWILADVNERAVELARRNTAFLGDRAQVVVSDGFAALEQIRADVVILNPPIRAGKTVVYRLFQEAHAHLSDEGVLWIVIQKKQGAPSARAELERLFRRVEEVDRAGGYFVFKSSKK